MQISFVKGFEEFEGEIFIKVEFVKIHKYQNF